MSAGSERRPATIQQLAGDARRPVKEGKGAEGVGSAARWDPPIRIGISACLLGQPVRYDGGHKRDPFLVETLGRFVEWVPVCPEVELGLGTPREAIRLVAGGAGVRLVGQKTATDHSAAMRSYAQRRVAGLKDAGLCGYVLKKNSPSCGMARVKVYGATGMPTGTERGLFADALMRAFPTLPVEEEGRLTDPRLRDNFIERVFAYRRLRLLFRAGWTRDRLVRFHTTHKLQLLAHSPAHYQRLGRVVAGSKRLERAVLRSRYETEFMGALQVLATARRQVNVMHHMLGYFSARLDPAARNELLTLIDDYRHGLVPLIVPLTLVRHHVRQFDIAYLAGQAYLEPHPKELMLRNHV